MTLNTRFNPSCNGGLHLGHMYVALINEAVAHTSGGRFCVRFEDTAVSSKHLLSLAQQHRIGVAQQEDIAWLGIPVDDWVWQSDIDAEVTRLLREQFNYAPPPDEPWRFTEIIGNTFRFYPYAPTLTCRKVVMDWLSGINCLIRGIDLASEFSLYQFFCGMFGLPEPRHIHLPRLQGPEGDVSKTNGSTTIADLRARGMTPAEVRGLIERACLSNDTLPWALHNLNPEPRL